MVDQENRHPNQYSVPRDENPLTLNLQNYPSKPVKTAGCYIPRKKKAAIPTCVLNKEEMTPDDIQRSSLQERLLDMQIKRDMLRDKINHLELKCNPTSRTKLTQRDLESIMGELDSEIMRVRLQLRSLGGLK